jgi:hypothetical protein
MLFIRGARLSFQSRLVLGQLFSGIAVVRLSFQSPLGPYKYQPKGGVPVLYVPGKFSIFFRFF